MCGIVGFVTKSKRSLFQCHLSLFEEMLICDSVRGNDSTGAFTVLSNNQVKALKVATNPHYLLETDQWKRFKETAVKSGHILVGHNRKATFGQITRENAHPFIEGNIVLVHNGTVMDHKKMADVDVDSHAICHQISSEGYIKTLRDLKGSFALVWYDVTTKKLYLARNKERPLCFVETNDYVAFASEGLMLGWLLRRNNISFEKMALTPENEIMSLSFNPFKIEYEQIAESISVPAVYTAPITYTAESPVPPFVRYYENYPKGSEVIFCPDICMEDTVRQGRFKIKGLAYLPGKPVFNQAIAFLDKDVDEADAEDIAKNEKLIAKIRNVVLTESGQIIAYLENVRTDVIIDLWNDRTISQQEWNYFCDHIACSKCEKALDKKDNQLTSITKERDGYKVICADCVLANFNEMPPELQEKVTAMRTTVDRFDAI